MRKIIYVSIGIMVSASCSVGEDYVAPQLYNDATIAQTLNISTSKPLPAKWYNDFGDSQLTALVEKGINNSTDIKTAILRIKQARTQLQISKVATLPQIKANGSYNYENPSSNIGIAADSHYYTVGFDASWELDLWGKNRRQIEADRAILKATKYTLNNVRLTVVAEIVSNYIKLLESAENLHLATKNERLQSEILSTVKAKYNSGLTDETAYNEAKYLLETTRAKIPAYRAEIEQYHNALATIIGVLPSELKIKTDKSSGLFTASPTTPQTLTEFPASVVRLRPDVAAAEQNLIADNALVGVAIAELYPDVSISGLWGYASQGGSKLIRSSSQTYNYAPLISLPLLDWNTLQNNVRLQKYIKAEALENYKQSVLNALAEIMNAQKSYAEALIGAKNQYAALQNMRKAVDLIQTKYQNGLIEFSDVVTAQQNLVSAEQAYTAIRTQILQNKIAFYKAVASPL